MSRNARKTDPRPKAKSVADTARNTKDRQITVKPVDETYAERVTMDSAGRLVVPARIRKALDLKGGQELSICLEGDVIVLQTLDTAIQKIQALVRDKRTGTGSVVDELIAERRAEAAKE
jgi:AbrB family looped-hinge helix DNA binding protein